MIDRRVKLFLEVLKDGRWHRKIPLQKFAKIPLYVVEACQDLELVECELTRIRGTRNYNARFRITQKGRIVLHKGAGPTPEDIHRLRYGGYPS